MFRHDSEVDITIDYEGSVEFDLTLVGILEIAENNNRYKFFFKQPTASYAFDQSEALVIKQILKWLDDNSTIKLPMKFGVKVMDFPEMGEDMEDQLDGDESKFHLEYLENFLKTLEKYEKNESEHSQSHKTDQYIPDYFSAYTRLGGKLDEDKFKEYIRFFLLIVPTVYVGNGYEIGIANREEAILQWMYYLQMKGENKDIIMNDSELVFVAVDSIHALT